MEREVLFVTPDGGWGEVNRFFLEAARYNAPAAWIGSGTAKVRVSGEEEVKEIRVKLLILPSKGGYTYKILGEITPAKEV